MSDEMPIYCFVLVRADEGSTQEIVVAHGQTLEALASVVNELWTLAMASAEGPYAADNQHFLAEERDALLAMLARHSPCSPGRYVLRSMEPIWEQCTLVITAQDGGFFPP